jgi:hypothetical protein
MNLLIKGLTIPKDTESYSIKIDVFPNVTHYKTMFGANSLYSGKCKIFIMPEKYGDLIDRDYLLDCAKVIFSDEVINVRAIINAPTIIEAEESE